MPTCNVFRKEWVNYDSKWPKMTYDDTFTFTFHNSLGGLCQIHFAFLSEPHWPVSIWHSNRLWVGWASDIGGKTKLRRKHFRPDKKSESSTNIGLLLGNCCHHRTYREIWFQWLSTSWHDHTFWETVETWLGESNQLQMLYNLVNTNTNTDCLSIRNLIGILITPL